MMPRVAVRCEDLSVVLAGLVDADQDCSAGAHQHLQACLRCQAEVAGYRRLRRDMRRLEVASLSPDDELLEEVLRQVRPPAEVHRLRRPQRRLRRFGGRFRSGVLDRPLWSDRRTAGVTAGVAGVAGAVAGGAVLASRALVRSVGTN